MMKSILKSVFKYSLAVALIAAPVAVKADERPLAVINFASPYVDYQSSLGRAVAQAVKVKKEVEFEVIAGNHAAAGGNQVARDIMAMGVKPSKVKLRSSGVNNNEVLVFVR